MKIYYARCISIFNTPQESRDIRLLEGLGFEVYNPNNLVDEEGYRTLGMDYFKNIICGLPALAFRALPCGISAGVFKEIHWAQQSSSMIIELPSSVVRRALSVSATREYIIETGIR